MKQWFSLQHIYYAGSHEGCGCGFLKEGEKDADLDLHQENYRALARLLDAIIADGGKAEIFSCWEGDQSKPPVPSDELTVTAIVNSEFQFKERQFIRALPQRTSSLGASIKQAPRALARRSPSQATRQCEPLASLRPS